MEFYCLKDSKNVVRCRQCGLIFSEPQGETNMEKYYSEEYFEPYLKTQAVHSKKRFRRRLNELKKKRSSGSLLDIGCGAGFFLKLASDEGYETSGVELSEWASEYAKSNFGLRVFTGYLEDARLPEGSFDIITLWHVLEHVTDPKEFLGQVNKLLKSNGIIAIEVPNIGSITARVSNTNWELMAPREHFYYFSLNTLERLLREAGFGIIDHKTWLWTTPKMFFLAKAATAKGLSRGILKLISLVVSLLSPVRFRSMPSFFEGDVITIYAAKTGERYEARS